MAGKVLMLIFLTPVLDMIVISWTGKVGQNNLTEPEIYFVRSVKFVLCLAAFALGLYSRIFREDVTLNFSVMPGQPQQQVSPSQTSPPPVSKEQQVQEPLLE